MRINPANNISFKRNINIIDAHTHDKPFSRQGAYAEASDILKFLNKPFESNGDTFTVTKMFPSSLDACFYDEAGKPYSNEIKGNRAVLKTFKKTDVNEFLAVCQPKTGDVKNIKKLFEKYPDKFIGLKFHPEGMKLEADSSLYDPYLKFAEEHKLPCLFHSYKSFDKTYEWKEEINGKIINKSDTVLKSKYSRPNQIYALAKRHPEVPVIMAHCGGPEKEDINAVIDAIISSAEHKDAKLYADLSWVDIDVRNEATNKREMPNIVNAIKRLKNSKAGDLTDRIMFGTDAPIDRYNSENAVQIYKEYVSDIHTAIKKNFGKDADDIIDKIFYKNAKNVYLNNPIKQIKKGLSKTSIGLAFLGISALIGTGIYIIRNKNNV